jgi:hypothetical protein
MHEPEQFIARPEVEPFCLGKQFAIGDADVPHNGKPLSTRHQCTPIDHEDVAREYAC